MRQESNIAFWVSMNQFITLMGFQIFEFILNSLVFFPDGGRKNSTFFLFFSFDRSSLGAKVIPNLENTADLEGKWNLAANVFAHECKRMCLTIVLTKE